MSQGKLLMLKGASEQVQGASVVVMVGQGKLQVLKDKLKDFHSRPKVSVWPR